MREDFYRQVVNALLLSESEARSGRTYQLVEHLKQVTNFADRPHNEILYDVEHSIRYSVELTVRSRRAEGFVVVVEKSANAKVAKEHRMTANKSKTIDVGESNSVVLRVFCVEEECESVAPTSPPATAKKSIRKTDSFLKRWVRFHSCKGDGFPIQLKDFQLQKEIRVVMPNDTVATFTITRRTDFTDEGFQMEALIELIRKVMRFNYELLMESDVALSHKYAGELCDSSDALLRQVCHFYEIPILSRRLITLSVILGWRTNEMSIDSGAVDNLLKQIRCSSHKTADESRESSEFLSKQSEDYMEQLLAKSKTGVFFPPENSNFLYEFTCSIQQVLNICNLEIWQHHSDLCPILDAKVYLERLIQRDSEAWIDQLKVSFESTVTLDQVCLTVERIQTLFRQFGHKYALFFNQFNITYAHAVLEALDQKLSDLICDGLRTSTAALNPRNAEELIAFTKKSMRLFDGIRVLLVYANNPPALNLNCFEEWFQDACVFWTYAWRAMVKTCIAKAVAADGDDSHSTEGNVSESAVMLLGLCKALCDDFVRLRPTRPKILLTCVLKISSILSDNMVSYGLRLRESLREHTPIGRVIRVANSVEHVVLQLTSNYHRFLRTDRLRNHLSEHEYTVVQSSMSHMFSAAQKTCVAIVDFLVEHACFLKRDSIREHTEAITMYAAETSKRTIKSYMRQLLANERAEGLLAYLERSICLIETSCLPSLFMRAHESLWKVVEGVVLETMLYGQPAEYYVEVERDCERIARLLDIPFIRNSALGQRIHLNKVSTQDVALQYYSVLADLCASWPNRRQAPDEKPLVPKVMLRLGYLRSTNAQIILHAHILNGFDVPILDRITQSSDPYVRIEFYPRSFFPLASFPAQSTQMKKQTLRPYWNESFQFLIPEELFFTNGACLCLTVLDHDVLSYNDLAGQALIPLASIKKVKSFSSKHLPYPTTMAFPLPTPKQYTDYFKLLKERSAKDPLAKEIHNYEKYVRDYRLLPPEALDDKDINVEAKRIFTAHPQKLRDFFRDFI